MRTNLLLMCKLMFLLLVFNGFYSQISDPFIPFIPFLDVFHKYPGVFKWSLKTLFLIGGVGLLFNVKVRIMAILLGVSVILMLLASKPLFRNHLFICGCAFLLSGLTDKSQDPWLLYLQLSLVYLGAVFNKVLQIDWWNGQFMHNWLLVARENPYYEVAYELFPNRILATVLSWGSMATELSISIMLLFKKYHKTAVWIILIFHTSIFTLTASRFGHFFEDIVIYLLVFSSWPTEKIQVFINSKKTLVKLSLLRFLNWNYQWVIKEDNLKNGHWLHIRSSNKEYFDIRAIGYLILYTPATYFLLLFFDSGTQLVLDTFLDYPLNRYGMYFITSVLLWGGIIFFGSLSLKPNFLVSRQRNDG